MDERAAFVNLRDILADLYPDQLSAQRIAFDAGIDTRRIEFTAHAINNWHSILREAENTDKLDSLMEVVLSEYGTNPELQRVWGEYQRSREQDKFDPPSASQGLQDENQDSGGHGVTVGNVSGGIKDTIIAGRDVIFQDARSHLPESTSTPEQKPAPIEIEWVRIPAGEFLDGNKKAMVYLEEFYISKYPVTNVQYKVFVDTNEYEAPKHWEEGKIPVGKENHPVVYVTWSGAQAFSNWLGGRLPMEEEWEKAARGGIYLDADMSSQEKNPNSARIYPWGDEEPNKYWCNFSQNIGDTTPVGRYSPKGDSPYGVVDMAGNVWEWCEDWYDKKQIYRVVRGGGWYQEADTVGCGVRLTLAPQHIDFDFGFRVVRSEITEEN